MRQPKNKEVWVHFTFGNFPDVVHGDLVRQDGMRCFVDFIGMHEPDIHEICQCFVFDSELEAYNSLYQYLARRLDSISKNIIRLEAGNNK